NERGCYSYIGMLRGTQQLSLQNGGCDTLSTATHELEHALGVYHEQSRADRASYVTVDFSNIAKNHSHNFLPHTTSNSYGLPYDFGSNMHYTSDSFAINRNIPTLIATRAYTDYQNSMRGHMPSFLDVLKVNRHYKCDRKCANKANPCKNGGYLDVKTCSKCVCPEGLGGADCTGNPNGCSVEWSASPSFTKKIIEMGKYGSPARLNYENCAYIIKAPVGRKIEVVVDGVWTYGASQGCNKGGIEIKTETNLQRRGFRFCVSPTMKKSYTSESNRLPILVWYNEGSVRADIQFKY
ncbi:hypothetical protein PFISCL1PPCAC_27507, partial [Pristionchus fissidentatus]